MDELIARLVEMRAGCEFPPGLALQAESIGTRCLALLYPQFASTSGCDPRLLRKELELLRHELDHFESSIGFTGPSFIEALPALRGALDRDADAIWEGDPAATSRDEVILAYPGFFAIAIYRLAHHLNGDGWPLLPRLLTEWAHRQTGIDIHPGAAIGSRFCIDHGTGIVIGETSVIGDDVKLFQGVTLGALSVRKEFARLKRHPTLEDHVVVYANATILGGETVIGAGSVIGGSAWVTTSVPSGSRIPGNASVAPLSGDFFEPDYII